jgi:hypothetical protein
MNKLIHIIINNFSENFFLLILLSFSWVIIIIIFRGLKVLIPYLLLRAPIYLIVKSIKYYFRFPFKPHKSEIVSCNIREVNPIIAERRTKRLSELIRFFDQNISAIQDAEYGTIRFLFNKEIVNKMACKIYHNDVILLEKYLAIYGTFSGEKSKRKSGLLNLVGNRMSEPSEIRNVLFYALECGHNDIKLDALYHIFKYIKGKSEILHIKNLVSNWEKNYKIPATNLIRDYENILSTIST